MNSVYRIHLAQFPSMICINCVQIDHWHMLAFCIFFNKDIENLKKILLELKKNLEKSNNSDTGKVNMNIKV